MFEVKEKIISTLRATNRDHIEYVLEYMQKHAFYTQRCHGHHRHEGGLSEHSWQTYQIALQLVEEGKATDPAYNDIDMNSLAICSLLHDFHKCNGMSDVGGHGLRSVMMLAELGVLLSEDEYLAIRFYMSLNDHKSHTLFKEAHHCLLRKIVHTADKLSKKMLRGSEITEIEE